MNGTDDNYAEIIRENEITVGCSSEGRVPPFPFPCYKFIKRVRDHDLQTELLKYNKNVMLQLLEVIKYYTFIILIHQ